MTKTRETEITIIDDGYHVSIYDSNRDVTEYAMKDSEFLDFAAHQAMLEEMPFSHSTARRELEEEMTKFKRDTK